MAATDEFSPTSEGGKPDGMLKSEAVLAVPTPDHYLPLLYVIGARQSREDRRKHPPSLTQNLRQTPRRRLRPGVAAAERCRARLVLVVQESGVRGTGCRADGVRLHPLRRRHRRSCNTLIRGLPQFLEALTR